jgi:beta-galactosidase/beta-glucuronidase
MEDVMQTPRPEHPNPQFYRESWINLNGMWTYKINMRPPYFDERRSINQEECSTGFDDKIVVPFAPESELSSVSYKDLIYIIFYHRTIEIPSEWKGKRILLHFGAVFYHSEVFIDGVEVGFHSGGSSSFTIDLSPYVEGGASYNLVVKVTSNLQDGSIPSGKQSNFLQSYKCFYTRTTGIWQTVWLEAVAPTGLDEVVMHSDIDEKTLFVTPHFHALVEGMKFAISVRDRAGKEVAQTTTTARQGVPIALSIDDMHLWNVEDPYLYDVVLTTLIDDVVVDQVDSYMGMRKVEIIDNQVYFNNKILYQRLVLDQGYYPQSQWTAPSDEALKRDIELGKAAGFNGARLHQKVFEKRFLYWADTLGYLCWGESASWGLEYNNPGLPARNFLSEWAEIVRRDRNHPSIIAWTPFNETFRFVDGNAHRRVHRDAYNLCKMIDPSRPVNDASGYVHFVTDLWTVHSYQQDPKKLAEQMAIKDGKPFRNFPDFESEYDGQPYLVDEYGGIKWDPETQLDEALLQGQNLVSWGYGESPRTLEEFYQRLEALTEVVLSMDHCCGYCYTQLTDVEQEKNGIYFYNRSEKFDMERVREIFSRVPKRYRQ